MATFDNPEYILDFGNPQNCATVQGAKPQQEVSVLVRPDKQPDATPIEALGKRSADGDTFEIIVTTSAGTQSHTWSWGALHDAIRVQRRRRN